MKTRVLSILILFLLITSVSIPVVSAKEASKNTIESTIEEDIKFVIESIHEYGKVQKMAIESPIMQEININGAIGAAEGAAIGAKGGGLTGGVIGGLAGGAAGLIEGYTSKIIKGEKQ
ncbi:MAG: hypothetical protein MJ007_07970 [Paludibacteraceae bacterium]|nr:hypothetical protein [Paludibacteraceae bacterium]